MVQRMMLKAVMNQSWEQWFDFTCTARILSMVLETTTDDEKDSACDTGGKHEDEEEKEIIDLQGRLESTLGDVLAHEAMDLMHVLHGIGVEISQGSYSSV